MHKQILTQEYLKSMLHYCPDTGVFTRIKDRSGGARIGSVAGWNNGEGYLRIRILGGKYLAHRLAWLYMTGSMPKNQIDHINHIRSDNRICNLRDVTHDQNQRNRSINSNNSSGVCGVKWHYRDEIWESVICVNGKQISLGSFKIKVDAIIARKMAEYDHFYHKNHGANKPIKG